MDAVQGALAQEVAGRPLHLSLCHSEMKWANVLRMSALIGLAALIALHRVKMVKIGSVVFELNRGRK